MAFGRKNALGLEIFGTVGSIGFDLERLNELWVDSGEGRTRVLVTESDHPHLAAWWPPGHVLGWDHTFTTQAATFLAAHRCGQQPVTVVRGRPGRAAGARRDRAQRDDAARPHRPDGILNDPSEGVTMGKRFTLFTGQWADLTLEEVAGLAAGWGYDGLEIAVSGEHLDAWRWDDDDYVEGRLDILRRHGLGCWAISNHLKGQAVCDDPIDDRHRSIVGAQGVGRRGSGGGPASGRPRS